MMSTLIPVETEVLAGLELGGVPLATAMSLKTGLPTVFVRKTAKNYGTSKIAEGEDLSGKKVLIIEDVITSGGQVLISAEDLKKLGAQVIGCLCVIDRETGGKQKLTENGIPTTSLFTMTELKSSST